LQEYLPSNILSHYQLEGLGNAYWQLHFPQTLDAVAIAKRRLKFNELLVYQWNMQKTKQLRVQKYQGHPFKKVGDYTLGFYKQGLPFELTNAQKKVIKHTVRHGKACSNEPLVARQCGQW
jgi:ATP-dependent DNA helicase RecG